MIRQATFLCRSLLPNGENGVAIGVPADVRRDLDLEAGDSVDIAYDREDGSLRVEFE